MSSPPKGSSERVHALIAASVAVHDAVAQRLGINGTDLRCLGLATTEPGLTATRLAELAGLTTGAITGVVDRLEAAGFVRREADPADRRRIRVQLVEERLRELGALYQGVTARVTGLTDDRDEASRAHMAAYLDSLVAALQDEASRLRIAARGGLVGDTYTAPVGDVARGRLLFVSGAPRVAFGKAALGQSVRFVAETVATRLHIRPGGTDELVRSTFEGPSPEIRQSRGVVTMRYKRRLLDPRSRVTTVELNPDVAWAIEVEGGVTDLDADLRALRVTSLDIRGGANHLQLHLGRPDGTSRVALDGGTSDGRITRPRGVAIAVHVPGGVSDLVLDGRKLRGVDGGRRLQSDDFAGAIDRWEVELGGASSDVAIARA